MELTVKLICKDLPGATFDDASKGLHYNNVHVGIQHKEDVIDTVRGDGKSAEFTPVFKVAPIGDGTTNFTGPFAKGTKTERFFYLSWGEVKFGGFHMFRRAKIHLSHLKWTDVEKFAKAGKPITAHISLTDNGGWPLCASVKSTHLKWDV